MNRPEAADLFLSMILARARTGVIADLQAQLSEGPPGRKPAKSAVDRHEWFQNLGSDDKERTIELIGAAVDSAIFGVMVVLDGLSGGNPLEGVTSDFSLSLQTYASEQARSQNATDVAVRINPSDTTEPLHDLLRWKLGNQQQAPC